MGQDGGRDMGKRKKKARDVDNATLVGIELQEVGARKKAKPAPPVAAPWDAVAAECPCRASADAHRVPMEGVVRVHIEAANQPIMCVPGTMTEGRTSQCDYAPRQMPHGWRKSSHYLHGELGGRA